MSKPQLPLAANERMHTGSRPSNSHHEEGARHLPTDDATRLNLRSKLMEWAEATPAGTNKHHGDAASDRTPGAEGSSALKRSSQSFSSTQGSIPINRVKREPPPSTFSRLRGAAADACITLGDYCQQGVEWCSEQFSIASRGVRSIASLFWKQTGTAAIEREQNPPLVTLIAYLRAAWFGPNSTPEPTIQTLANKENEQRSRGIASPTLAVSSAEATASVKDAILAFAEALRSSEKKRVDERTAAIEQRRRDLEQAIEHLKSHDSGATNPILRDLIIAMSSDYAAMPLEVAEELLRIAELKEQEESYSQVLG